MKQTFKQFLGEGIIQNPPKLLKAVTDYAVTCYLAYAKDQIETELTGKDYAEAIHALKKAAAQQKLQLPDDALSEKIGKTASKGGIEEREFKLDMSDLPSRYLEKLKKLKIDVTKLHEYDSMIIELDFSSAPKHRNIGAFFPAHVMIALSFRNAGLLLPDVSFDRLMGQLHDKLPSFIGTIAHEMTHAVQFLVLKNFHASNISAEYDQDDLKDDAPDEYYLSTVEFDPTIKSEAAYFKSVEDMSKEFGMSDYDKQAALSYFTYADGSEPSAKDLERISYTRRSKFFGVLKKHDQQRWRKAIKLLTQLV